MKFYVYQIRHKETNQFYIGSRLCKDKKYFNLQFLDFGVYKTSSRVVKDIGFDNFELVYFNDNFDSYDECYSFEQHLIKDNIQNSLCINKNYCLTEDGVSYKFFSYGIEVSKETRDKISQKKIGKKRISYPRKPHSNITKEKMAIAKLGKPNVHTQNMNANKIECPHCNRLFNLGNYKNHHGDKCKLFTPSKADIV
jgi:hypothetical protein